MKKNFVFLLVVFLMSIIFFSHFVLAVPELPMIVSGDVYINDKPAKIGTEITAKMEGEEVVSVEISEKGSYTFLLQKLEGKGVIKLYVDDIDTGESVTYESGGFEQLTLKVEKSYLVYYLGVALVLLIIGIVIWKQKLTKKRRKK